MKNLTKSKRIVLKMLMGFLCFSLVSLWYHWTLVKPRIFKKETQRVLVEHDNSAYANGDRAIIRRNSVTGEWVTQYDPKRDYDSVIVGTYVGEAVFWWWSKQP